MIFQVEIKFQNMACTVSADVENPNYDIAPLAIEGPLSEIVMGELQHAPSYGPEGHSYEYPRVPLGAVLHRFAAASQFSAEAVGEEWPQLSGGL